MNNTTIPTIEKINIHADNATKSVVAYMAQLSTQRGRDVQRQALDRISCIVTDGRVCDCRLFPWHLLRYEHTQAIRAKLIDCYKPSTVNRFIAALRGVLRAAWRIGQITAENYQRAADLKCVKSSNLPTGREISSGELSLIFSACSKDTTTAGVRDFALFAVMYGGGLRRAELASLTFADFEQDTQRIRINGKGNKERFAYLPAGAVSALRAWVILRGDRDGALFVRIRKGAALCSIEKCMTGQAIYTILLRRAAAAGVSDISPHDMRRTFVSNLLDNGQDLSTVSKMAGHANVQTTMRYDRRSDEAKRRAALTLAIPFMDGVTCL
jgi:site-specific recombinase XerD